MKAEELLRALGSTEEVYIHEAETAVRLKKPLLLRLIPLAACLTLVLGLGHMQHSLGRISMESGDPELLPAGPQETAAAIATTETVREDKHFQMEYSSTSIEDQTDEELNPEQMPQQQEPAELPSLLVRIECWEENGFQATVTGIVDTTAYPVGTRVTVRFREKIQIAEKQNGSIFYRSEISLPEEFSEGSIVQIRFISENGILYAEEIAKEGVF